MTQQSQKISVRSDTLLSLMSDIAKGNHRIPQFQREFVWKRPKVIALFDSIYQEFPIGSFFLWKAGKEYNRLFRHIVDLGVPPVREHDSISFIIDGQQRATSLYAVLHGLTLNGTDYGRICFDLREERFTARRPDKRRHVAVCDVWGADAMALSQELDKEYLPAFSRCWRRLQTYPVSLVEVTDKELPAVCKIFRRINQGGQRLGRFDLISAMTFTPDFDLRQRLKDDLTAPLKAKQFGSISEVAVTQLLALAKHGQCTERYEYQLTTDDIKKHWKAAVSAVLLATDTLRKNMGVSSFSYLPYGAQLTLLAYYFMKSGKRALPPDHLEWVQRWFWRTSFGQYYGQQGPTRTGRDSKLFDQLIEGKTPGLDVPVHLAVTDLVKTRMTWTGSAVRNAFLCLLAHQRPRHLLNNSPLDLVDGGISDFTTNEKHHIFPTAFLQQAGPARADIHSLSNFCFLPSELNKRIRDKAPATYMAEFQEENPQFAEAARSHLLPTWASSGVTENDYLLFLQTRGLLLLEEIERLCGEVTTPREDERQEAVSELERRIRDCIDTVLMEHVGEGYWRARIPQAVRESAEGRIRDAAAKDPNLDGDDFRGPRPRLDYCNVMDYQTIIEKGDNWPFFEPTFRKKHELQRYLTSFSEYRNAVMHNRPMTELVQKNGEAALIWFAAVLSQDEEPQEDEDNE